MRRLLIFGATGDLAKRLLMPALAALGRARQLPEDLQVVAIGRQEGSTEGYRRELNQPELDRLGLRYEQADVTRRESVQKIVGARAGPLLAYLALPPQVFPAAVTALATAPLPAASCLAVEKPFGTGLDSARRLNALLAEHFREDDIFRVDHFLSIQGARSLLGLRFANRLFEPVWNHQHIAKVEITWDETLALEGRAGYYDHNGALRDMVQNHLLQLLCLVAMEPPLSLGARDLRDRKAEVLRAVLPLDDEAVRERTVRARYTRGQIGERAVPSYVGEEGVDGARQIETFARVTLEIDSWRWAKVPFVLQSGKALAKERAEIVVHFRPVPRLAFGGATARDNVLRLRFDPDTLSIALNGTCAREEEGLEPVVLEAALAPAPLPAYARLLRAALEGDPAFFIRADEAEESWRIVEPILDGWRRGLVPLREYPAGSLGP